MACVWAWWPSKYLAVLGTLLRVYSQTNPLELCFQIYPARKFCSAFRLNAAGG